MLKSTANSRTKKENVEIYDFFVNMRNDWKGKRHCNEIINQSATKMSFVKLKNKKVNEC